MQFFWDYRSGIASEIFLVAQKLVFLNTFIRALEGEILDFCWILPCLLITDDTPN